MNFEIFTLLIAALITAGFLLWLEIANRKLKKRLQINSNRKIKK